MQAVSYRVTGFDEIDLICPLWEQLNAHHLALASRFRSHYEHFTFGNRKADFQRLHEKGHLRLDLAFDPHSGNYIGYCVTSVLPDLAGEIESVFVEPAYRSVGVGTVLVSRGLEWMDSLGTTRKRVSVSDGNEAAWAFYRKFGFYPRMTVLEQKKDPV